MPDAIVFDSVECTSKLDWLEKRRTGITATDTPQILGISPWGTALHVYTEKVEPAVEVPWQDLPRRLRWGLRLEDDLLAEYLMETGRESDEIKYAKLLRSRDYPWMLYSPDALLTSLVKVNGREIPLELKHSTLDEHWGPAGSDEVPMHYYVQSTHQQIVMGAPYGEIACLIGGEDFRIYHIEPKAVVRDHVIQAATQFWDRVTKRDDPEPDWAHPSTLDLLSRMYGVDERQTIHLDGHALLLAREHHELGKQIHDLERARDQAKAHLLNEMGDCGRAILPDGWEMTRKTVNRKAYSVEAGSYTKFHVKPRKES